MIFNVNGRNTGKSASLTREYSGMESVCFSFLLTLFHRSYSSSLLISPSYRFGSRISVSKSSKYPTTIYRHFSKPQHLTQERVYLSGSWTFCCLNWMVFGFGDNYSAVAVAVAVAVTAALNGKLSFQKSRSKAQSLQFVQRIVLPEFNSCDWFSIPNSRLEDSPINKQTKIKLFSMLSF